MRALDTRVHVLYICAVLVRYVCVTCAVLARYLRGTCAVLVHVRFGDVKHWSGLSHKRKAKMTTSYSARAKTAMRLLTALMSVKNIV